MNPITFKELKRIINEMQGADGVTDDTIVLVPTTKLLDKMRPLMTVGHNLFVYAENGLYTIAATPENEGTKQMGIILC